MFWGIVSFLLIVVGVIWMFARSAPNRRELDASSRDDRSFLASQHNLEIFAHEVLVHGTEYRQEAVEDFVRAGIAAQKSGEGAEALSLRLERDPDNEYDEYAIKVIGEWRDGGRKRSRHIGFVPRKLAYKIAMNVDEDKLLKAVFLSMKNNDEDGFDIKFDIVIPR